MPTANGPAPDKTAPKVDNQPARPAPARLLRGLLFFLMLFCLVLAGLWIALPRIAQELLVPVLARSLQAPEMRVDIRRADFRGLDLGDISLSREHGLTAGAVLVDWSLSGLLQGRIDRVSVLGLEVRVRKNDEKWEIPGLPRLEKSSNASAGPTFMPTVGQMYVDGRISLEGQGPGYSLPFSVNGSLDEDTVILLDAKTALAGQEVTLALQGNLRQNDFQVTCVVPPASIAALASLVPALEGLPLAGTLRGVVEASLLPDQKPALEAALGLDSFQSVLGGTSLAQDGNATLSLAWQNEPQLSLSALSLGRPPAADPGREGHHGKP